MYLALEVPYILVLTLLISCQVGERMKSMNDQCQRLREMGKPDMKKASLATPVLQSG